jgi:hypothetical protein
MRISYSQYRESSFLYPFVLCEWLHKVQSRIEESKYWEISFQNEFFRTNFLYVAKNSGKFYVGSYTGIDGEEKLFTDVTAFLAAQKAFSVSYDKRIEDYVSMLRKGQENGYENWEQVRYKWKG